MRNQNNHNTRKTQVTPIDVCATLSEPQLLTVLVDQLAERLYDNGYHMETVQPGWQAFDTSSLEAYASGDLGFIIDATPVKIPFDACFVFTCIKAKKGSYHLTWGSSLS